jgi:heme/copper-type cytochrome/quinol oxidase subunit 4
MSEMKTAGQHNAPITGHSELHGHPVDFNSYLRRCIAILAVVLCAVGLMIWASYLPQDRFSWSEKVVIILLIASVNAFFVAGFLMHLLSERKMVYTILGFTVSFVIGLFGLTIWAMNDFPSHTITR